MVSFTMFYIIYLLCTNFSTFRPIIWVKKLINENARTKAFVLNRSQTYIVWERDEALASFPCPWQHRSQSLIFSVAAKKWCR